MLSDETTVGRYPVEAVETMHNIATTIEAANRPVPISEVTQQAEDEVAASVTRAIARQAIRLKATAIVALSETGATARLIARHRPPQPILVITPNERTYYQALLIHGCVPVLVPKTPSSIDAACQLARTLLKKYKLTKVGERFILGAGIPFGVPGSTNVFLAEQV
jgi:pyruvate kinase